MNKSLELFEKPPTNPILASPLLSFISIPSPSCESYQLQIKVHIRQRLCFSPLHLQTQQKQETPPFPPPPPPPPPQLRPGKKSYPGIVLYIQSANLLPERNFFNDSFFDPLLPLPDEELPPRVGFLVVEMKEEASKEVADEGGNGWKEEHQIELCVRGEG